jgi:predicted helicase
MAELTLTDRVDQLKNIRNFPSLIKFLHKELDWPISSEDFEELTFDYTPEELGIDTANKAKIQEIKRLRPLSTNQPWGIFFVKFEPKKLPVVALRRILSRVVVKKRASVNSAERPAWQMDDLLFVSNYGEGEERQISFAHFAHNGVKNDLPTLKVLGWDNLDTPLHLDHVADVLSESLAWPEDEDDTERWRETWRSAFTLRHREVITTSKVLAVRLAELARAIRDRINTVLAIETEDGPVTKLMAAFKETLIHDLDEDEFADMYAQTIAYGLLSARITDPRSNTADDFAAHMRTNPFLKEMMETFLHIGGRHGKKGGLGIDFDELGVSEVVELLDDANIEAVVRDFGDRNPQEDPVIHFYEDFLTAYDKKQKVERGVFYTPLPVVSHIVRSVDESLRTEFGLEDGLADTTTWGEIAERLEGLEIPEGMSPNQAFVQILDPATGTGTFLVEIIDLIHRTLTAKWKAKGQSETKMAKLWNDYVPRYLLPRLHGYELLMAPYAIAHLKVGLKLYETGYHFDSDERARIYLTNALEPAHDFSETLAFSIPALAREAETVNAIKEQMVFSVVIGNPPYASLSSNMTEWIRGAVNHYLNIQGKRIEEKSKRNHLQNDYIKFMRIADLVCSRSQLAVFAYITSNSYLDGRTLRGLRWNLMQTFRGLKIFNLWGDSNKRNAQKNDENVFDITEGVSIILGTRTIPISRASVAYAEIQGPRGEKYRVLENDTFNMGWLEIAASAPYYMFTDIDEEVQIEFDSLGPPLDQVFEVNGAGMKSNRDRFATDEDPDTLLLRMDEFAQNDISDEDIREKYGLKDNYTWKLPKARADFRSRDISAEKIVPLAYRPFDNRYVYYDKAIVFNRRVQVMRHLISGSNLAIVTIGQNESRTFNHAFVSRFPPEIKMATHYGASVVCPVYLYSNRDVDLFSEVTSEDSNFTNAVERLCEMARQSEDSCGNPDVSVAHYIYAILYSPKYRTRYAEQFLTGFPRVPDTPPAELFIQLCAFGADLVGLHLVDNTYEAASWNVAGSVENCPFEVPTVSIVGNRPFTVEKASYSHETVWIDKAKTRGFQGVLEEVWNFHLGGYQVCHKWLKDRQAKGGKNPRPGRILTDEDINHYQKIVVALNETIRIMGEIDDAIEEHGGWPDAFVH